MRTSTLRSEIRALGRPHLHARQPLCLLRRSWPISTCRTSSGSVCRSWHICGYSARERAPTTSCGLGRHARDLHEGSGVWTSTSCRGSGHRADVSPRRRRIPDGAIAAAITDRRVLYG
jgi:hypothetical protein